MLSIFFQEIIESSKAGFEYIILLDDDGVFISKTNNHTFWVGGNKIPSNPFQYAIPSNQNVDRNLIVCFYFRRIKAFLEHYQPIVAAVPDNATMRRTYFLPQFNDAPTTNVTWADAVAIIHHRYLQVMSKVSLTTKLHCTAPLRSTILTLLPYMETSLDTVSWHLNARLFRFCYPMILPRGVSMVNSVQLLNGRTNFKKPKKEMYPIVRNSLR